MRASAGALVALVLAAGPAAARDDSKAKFTAPTPAAQDIAPEPQFAPPVAKMPTPQEIGQLPVAPAAPPDPNADLAYGAYQRGLYRAAFTEAMKRAQAQPPNAAAMTLIGQLYADGSGLVRKPEEAVRWWTRAVAAGDRGAMLALGLAKLAGDGTALDKAGAATLFDRAGKLGEPQALYDLAVMELQGDGVARDVQSGARRMKVAADAGDSLAQYAYAILLKEGRGVEKDVNASSMWLGRAAGQGEAAAMVEYAIAQFNGVGVPKDEQAAAALFRKAADRGNAIAQNRLARLYAYGRGVENDPARAVAWNRLARDQGLNDPWLEGFSGKLVGSEREEADRLIAKWSAGLGPVAAVEPRAAPPAKP